MKTVERASITNLRSGLAKLEVNRRIQAVYSSEQNSISERGNSTYETTCG